MKGKINNVAIHKSKTSLWEKVRSNKLGSIFSMHAVDQGINSMLWRASQSNRKMGKGHEHMAHGKQNTDNSGACEKMLDLTQKRNAN